VTLRVDASIRSKEGPLEGGKEKTIGFRTYGPLEVARFWCNSDTPHGNCDPAGGFALEVTNDVKFSDLKKAIRVDPPVKIQFSTWRNDDSWTKSIEVFGRFKPGQ